MAKRLCVLSVFAVAVVVLLSAAALAISVKLTPVKNATYRGTLNGELAISVKVDRIGRTAKISLADAPIFCSAGGLEPEPHSGKPASITRQGALTGTITYLTSGGTHRTFAKVFVKGHFYTFGKAAPVFQGTIKATYVLPGSTSCSGQESFEAIK